jgi:hypothetical protein
MIYPLDMEILSQQKAIEQVLTARFGGKARLGQGMALNERTHVARFPVLEAPAECPATVIVKGWTAWDDQTYEPESKDPWSPSSRLFNDWAALQFLSEVMGDSSPAPRYVTGDRAIGFFVMEDIGSGIDPAQALLGNDPRQAEALILELAASLGRMHAATAGQKATYEKLRTELGPVSPWIADRNRALISDWLASLEKLGIKPRPGIQQDLDRVLQALIDPGPFLAFNHGDPCPDNWRNINGRLRLFDFETSGFRHALQDGVYGRMHFPSCWCVNRFPPEIPLAMERAYRSDLVKGVPEAADDRLFNRAVAEICAFWVLAACVWYKLPELMEKDGEWGISTLRQRIIVRSGIFAELTASTGHLQALGETVAELREFLRSRWPPEAEAMPLYPAFQGNIPPSGFGLYDPKTGQ